MELINLIAQYISIHIATYIVTYNIVYTTISKLIFNKYKLNKLSKTGYIINSNIPTPPKIDKLKTKKEIYKIIFPYIEKLKKYTDEENLNNLYRNASSLKLEKQKFPSSIVYSGTYNARTNKITLATKSALGHEILHLASSYHDPKTKINYIGFKQGQNNIYIGQGLNEGYTELLASRLYNKDNKITVYKNEAKIARLFEFFFDDPKEMEKYYFNHDLPGFIYHMQSFSSRREVINLLLDIDEINDYSLTIGNLFPTIKSIKTQLTLYSWFERNCKDTKKVQAFRNAVCENKMAEIILNGKQAVLQRPKTIQATAAMAR